MGDRMRTGAEPIRIGDQLRDSYASGWVNAPCTFVCSTGRVGTLTLTRLLALAPEAHSAHEPVPRLIHASYEAFVDRCADPRWRTVVLGARDDLLCDAHRRGRTYVETSNRLTFLAPALAEVFPDSRFVHLHRHPYEFVRSAVRRGHYDGHHWDFARPRPRPGDAELAEWDSFTAAERCGWLWAVVNRESAAFVRSLPAERALSVRADELFAGDAAVLTELFRLVGVSAPPDKAVRRVLGEQHNAQQVGDFALDDATRRAVDKLVGPVAEQLGYVLGDG